MPEDDMSEDEFDGYVDDGDEDSGERVLTDTNESEDGPSIPAFDRSCGCAEDMTDASPLQFFQQFVTDEMLKCVVQQTNLYAQQYHTPEFTAGSGHLMTWLS